MFEKLLSEGGLSLDRLKTLLEVAAAGGIAKATGGDPVRQSQYSRQIKELEDFFRVKLVERHGKGIRLTNSGRELARISRFFLRGLANFQRGCAGGEQSFRIGASATYVRHFLIPALSHPSANNGGTRYALETVGSDEIERRLHDLTLDFGVTTAPALSRPLQLKELGRWQLKLWVPKSLARNEKTVLEAYDTKQLPLTMAETELTPAHRLSLGDYPIRLVCGTFLEVMAALENRSLAGILPDFLSPALSSRTHLSIEIPALQSMPLQFQLAWNPRLFRLNPHAIRHRDFLFTRLGAPGIPT